MAPIVGPGSVCLRPPNTGRCDRLSLSHLQTGLIRTGIDSSKALRPDVQYVKLLESRLDSM